MEGEERMAFVVLAHQRISRISRFQNAVSLVSYRGERAQIAQRPLNPCRRREGSASGQTTGCRPLHSVCVHASRCMKFLQAIVEAAAALFSIQLIDSRRMGFYFRSGF